MGSATRDRLRKGRGAGFVAALAGGATDDLVECVLDDPRWDQQVEDRADYYARLFIATGASMEPLRRRLAEPDDEADISDFWLPAGVVAEMALRGHATASQALADTVASGAHWRICIDALGGVGGVELVNNIVTADHVAALVARVTSEELADAGKWLMAPWETWAERVPALQFVVRAASESASEAHPIAGPIGWAAKQLRRPEPPANLTSLSSAQLLAVGCNNWRDATKVANVLAQRRDEETLRLLVSTAESGALAPRVVALHALGKLGSPALLASAVEFLRRESTLEEEVRREHRLRRAYVRYLEGLPPSDTLTLAREWFHEPWPLSFAAEQILALHATPDDRPMLEAAGATALAESTMYRRCSLVDALRTAGPAPTLPLLCAVYQQVPYSYARWRVVEALGECAAGGAPSGAAREFLTEALWDCESGARVVACRALESSTTTASRLFELANDAHEDDEVRAAAKSKLGLP